MTLEKFIASFSSSTPPSGLSPALTALWFDKQDDWEKAHDAIQHESDSMSAAIHAYLHRKEGDAWNANYWYRTAGRKAFSGALENEWDALVQDALKQS
jgi:hypothetical protein